MITDIRYTSLNEIKSFRPCQEGWKDILRGQCKTEADDVLFTLEDALKSNMIADVLWLIGRKDLTFKPISIKFARNCADRAKSSAAAAYAANAAAAADYAAAAAAAAAAADYAAADYAAARRASFQESKQILWQIICEFAVKHPELSIDQASN